jgi:hypothetical protein
MFYFRYVALLLLSTVWVTDRTAYAIEATTSTKSPEQTVKGLYREVLVRAPSGLLDGANMRIFSPYLSRAVRQKITAARACEQDWYRRNPDRLVNAPFSWSETGIFTGSNERTYPGGFQIESTQAKGDASFRVVVNFRSRPSDGPDSWRVVDTLVQEGRHFVVNEVTFPKETTDNADRTLSEILSEGCAGSHWVGGQ